MHCDLSRYRSTTYTGVTCSLLFLHGLQGRYKDIGTSYISMKLAYQQEHGELAQLSNHLTTLALAQTLADANYGRMNGLGCRNHFMCFTDLDQHPTG
jgi:hypothetical protein